MTAALVPQGFSGQIPLDLPVRAARDRESFYVTASNALALTALDDWRNWPQARLALVGPEGAGKTHLAAVWSQETGAPRIQAADLAAAEARGDPDGDPDGAHDAAPDGAHDAAPDGAHDGAGLRALIAQGALAVEDADALADLPDPAPAERALFHLINLAAAANCALLLTGTEAPARWRVALPDLRTRLSALPIARLDPPDDRLLEGLAAKLLADRQLLSDPALPRYLATRGPRSHRGLAALVAAIDRAALADRRKPNVRLAHKVLAQLDQDGAPAPDEGDEIGGPGA